MMEERLARIQKLWDSSDDFTKLAAGLDLINVLDSLCLSDKSRNSDLSHSVLAFLLECASGSDESRNPWLWMNRKDLLNRVLNRIQFRDGNLYWTVNGEKTQFDRLIAPDEIPNRWFKTGFGGKRFFGSSFIGISAESLYFSNSSFDSVVFSRAAFENVQAYNSVFINCTFNPSSFSGCIFYNCSFLHSTFDKTMFSGTSFQSCDLESSDFSRAFFDAECSFERQEYVSCVQASDAEAPNMSKMRRW